jgi:hypothetical protein
MLTPNNSRSALFGSGFAGLGYLFKAKPKSKTMMMLTCRAFKWQLEIDAIFLQ